MQPEAIQMIVDRLQLLGFSEDAINQMTIMEALELIIVDNELRELM